MIVGFFFKKEKRYYVIDKRSVCKCGCFCVVEYIVTMKRIQFCFIVINFVLQEFYDNPVPGLRQLFPVQQSRNEKQITALKTIRNLKW